VLLVGLTGGVCTGKSTVDGMLRELEIPVLDADAVVHELLAPGGAAVAPVLARFGPDVATEDGGVDRKALGKLVFSDDEARGRLETIVHPLVLAESERRLERMAGAAGVELVVYDAALLVETGRNRRFDRLVVVTCTQEQQLERLMHRDGLSADDAGARIRSQLPIEKKAKLADYVIDNSGPWHETRRKVESVVRSLRRDAAALRDSLQGRGERSRELYGESDRGDDEEE
jgi:dephospho-CoA kinase